MLKEQRQSIISKELKKKNCISIEEIMAATDSSQSTTRRDLEEMEKAGLVVRIRGGASAVEEVSNDNNGLEPSFVVRQDMYLDEKQRIARAAHELIHEKETLLMGSGTTVCELSKLLYDISPLYVATNDLKSAIVLAEYPNVNLTVLGGALRERHFSLNGYFTEQLIMQMHADKCFLGIDAVVCTISLCYTKANDFSGKML